MKKLVLLCTHLAVGAVGFGLGVYALPILIEPDSPSSSSKMENQAQLRWVMRKHQAQNQQHPRLSGCRVKLTFSSHTPLCLKRVLLHTPKNTKRYRVKGRYFW